MIANTQSQRQIPTEPENRDLGKGALGSLSSLEVPGAEVRGGALASLDMPTSVVQDGLVPREAAENFAKANVAFQKSFEGRFADPKQSAEFSHLYNNLTKAILTRDPGNVAEAMEPTLKFLRTMKSEDFTGGFTPREAQLLPKVRDATADFIRRHLPNID